MGNGYFYTLSAIAQSFAAIISLYAIFAVYKLQILKNEKNELIIRLKNIIYNKDVARKYNRGVEYQKAEELKSEIFSKPLEDLLALSKKGYWSATEKITTAIEKLNESPKKIRRLLKYALIINGITIAFSLISLPLGDVLQKRFTILILVIAIILGLSSLCVTVTAIWLTISRE